MDIANVGVATVTWARTAAEQDLLGRALAVLSAVGPPVAIADRTASEAFSTILRGLPRTRVTVPDAAGLVPQVAASFRLAAAFATPFVCYTEPDKECFFTEGLRDFVAAAPEAADVGVVIAARSDASFATFPPMQRYCEGVINELVGRLTGVAGDYSYGPFLLTRSLLPLLDTIDPRVGWGWRHHMFLEAHRRGLRIVHVTGDFACPRDQRDEDDAERTHRLRQLSQNVLGLVA